MIEGVLLGVGVLALCGFIAQVISRRSRVPRVALILLMGLALGQVPAVGQVMETIRPHLDVMAEAILVVVLFYGGLSIDIEDLGRVLLPGLLLASVGAFLVGLVVGLGLFAAIGSGLVSLPGWSLLLSLTFGAIIAPNDPIAVFSAVGATGGGQRADTIAKLESGFDDTMVTTLVLMVFLPMLLAGQALAERIWSSTLYFGRLSALAIVVGYAGGWVGNRWLEVVRDEEPLVQFLYSMTLVSVVFVLGQGIGASGYVAVFILGLAMGRRLLPEREMYRTLCAHWDILFRVGEIAAFLFLGALVDVPALPRLAPAVLLVVGTLVLLARPWSVTFCTSFTDLSLWERVYVASIALKGLDPAVLSLAVVSALGAHEELIDLTFSVVLLITLVQSGILTILFRLGMFRREAPAAG